MVIAMGGSFVDDMVDGEEISIPRAIGAGLSAGKPVRERNCNGSFLALFS
jgi:hypothetical protein